MAELRSSYWIVIYYDPSEARSSSSWPPSMRVMGVPLPGLEQATGADMLITSVMGKPPKEMITHEAAPEAIQMLLQKKENVEIAGALGISIPTVMNIQHFLVMCSKGALVQRKTGLDLVNSIKGGHLTQHVIYKMTLWDGVPWLLFIGSYYKNVKDKVVVDDSPTGWDFSALMGALNTWQERGGNFMVSSNNKDADVWIRNMDKRMQEFDRLKVIPPKFPRQLLIADQKLDKNWITLATFPGIGEVLAKRILQRIGTLARAIEWLTDPDALSLEGKPSGIGKETLNAVRKWFQLESNNQMGVIGTEVENNGKRSNIHHQ